MVHVGPSGSGNKLAAGVQVQKSRNLESKLTGKYDLQNWCYKRMPISLLSPMLLFMAIESRNDIAFICASEHRQSQNL